jgi:hypothetical protein
VSASLRERPDPAIGRGQQARLRQVKPRKGHTVLECRATVLIGLLKERGGKIIALHQRVKDLSWPRLAAQIAHDLQDRREVAHKLRDPVYLLIVNAQALLHDYRHLSVHPLANVPVGSKGRRCLPLLLAYTSALGGPGSSVTLSRVRAPRP